MPNTEQDRQVGARMREAAKAKGYTQAEVAEMVGREQGTISRWWSGSLGIDKADMALYAEQVGVSEAWLWTGREELTPALIADTLAECLLGVMQGKAPGEVFDSMTREPWWLTPERRRLVDAAAEQLRETIRRDLPDWSDLSDYERRQALRQLVAPALPH